MLVLTYGRMAARELRDRLTSGDGPVPVATTFHARPSPPAAGGPRDPA